MRNELELTHCAYSHPRGGLFGGGFSTGALVSRLELDLQSANLTTGALAEIVTVGQQIGRKKRRAIFASILCKRRAVCCHSVLFLFACP